MTSRNIPRPRVAPAISAGITARPSGRPVRARPSPPPSTTPGCSATPPWTAHTAISSPAPDPYLARKTRRHTGHEAAGSPTWNPRSSPACSLPASSTPPWCAHWWTNCHRCPTRRPCWERVRRCRLDTERSTDHDWGPRLQILLSDGAPGRRGVTAMLARRLPPSFRGHPVAFPVTRDPAAPPGIGWRSPVWLRGWPAARVRPAAGVARWTGCHPAQRLAEITAEWSSTTGWRAQPGPRPPGLVSRDVWLYVLACQWQRIGQEEAFPGRCAEAGDELGSVVVTARLARDLMRLCLLMGRCYPPYSKWLGTAFARLPGAAGPPHPWPARSPLTTGPPGNGTCATPTSCRRLCTTGWDSPPR